MECGSNAFKAIEDYIYGCGSNILLDTNHEAHKVQFIKCADCLHYIRAFIESKLVARLGMGGGGGGVVKNVDLTSGR